jgi:hypothetical protein
MSRDNWMCPDDRFPIMGLSYGRLGERKHTVPMALMLEHERQAVQNHGQTIHRLKERGGLSWCELSAVLDDRKHCRMDADAAHERAMRSVLVWQDRQRRLAAQADASQVGTETGGRSAPTPPVKTGEG